MGRLGGGAQLATTLARWRRTLLIACALVAAGAALAREQIAAVLSVEETWAAAATLPTACLWLLLSVERGVLQGLHEYRPVAWSLVLEALGRVAIALVLVAAGLGVSGAYLGTPLSMLAVAVGLSWITDRRLGRPARGVATESLRELMRGAWPAVLGLFLVAVLQNVDVIMVKRQIGGDEAGAYAAAAVAAKAIVWVAIGVGLYLLPTAVRQAREGGDARPVLLRALAVVSLVALPMLVAYAAVPELVLRLAFGEETVGASGALFPLGLAMTLLAAAYLSVQYMLALRRVTFLYALAAVAGAEIALLSGAGLSTIEGFAVVVLGLQAAAALSVLALGLAQRPLGEESPEDDSHASPLREQREEVAL
jgi:O-antigen/teichoic acid export membrane protein